MRQDFLRDEDGDILIKDGDFVTGQSDQQHVGDIFIGQMGEIKQWPLCGFGAVNYLKRSVTKNEFRRDLKIQLEYDKYVNAQIDDSKGIENIVINI
ncbi:MAG: hypothetical protein GX159_09850 [Flavobacteriaceae bacterium]|jgi:hypothetical protein|nr:hypothetical protein [Flavobacteriaceae bacterium]